MVTSGIRFGHWTICELSEITGLAISSFCQWKLASVPPPVVCPAEQAQIFRFVRASVGIGLDMVDLQSVPRCAFPLRQRILELAAALIALPDRALRGSGDLAGSLGLLHFVRTR